MNCTRHARAAMTRLATGLTLALTIAGAAQAQDAAPLRRAAPGHGVRIASERPLTVRHYRPHLISGEPIVAEDGFYDGLGIFRRWNDPRLDSVYGWRLGGDNFYGDSAGDPITRGNAGLGMIAGYGPARGGYGGRISTAWGDSTTVTTRLPRRRRTMPRAASDSRATTGPCPATPASSSRWPLSTPASRVRDRWSASNPAANAGPQPITQARRFRDPRFRPAPSRPTTIFREFLSGRHQAPRSSARRERHRLAPLQAIAIK